MHQELILAGMGGQGVLVIGQLLAHAAVAEGKNVVWFPSYGPETRGGASECTVVISDDEIGSPVASSPDMLLVLTQPLLDKFAPKVKRGGIILYNSSLAESPDYRSDCKIVSIAANDIADEIGSTKIVNMVALGAYVALVRPVKLQSVIDSLNEVLPERHHNTIPLNTSALKKGAEIIEAQLAI